MVHGDVWGTVMCNMLFSILIHRVQSTAEHVKVNSLYDDTLLRASASDVHELRMAWWETTLHTAVS
eukprot:1729793-Karenia_brevis.AAC.1